MLINQSKIDVRTLEDVLRETQLQARGGGQFLLC